MADVPASVYVVTSKVLAAQYTAVSRDTVLPNALPTWLVGAYHVVGKYLTQAGLAAVGPPFARFLFYGDVVVVEAGYPTPIAVPRFGTVEPSDLPAVTAAVTVHRGPYRDIDQAYTACSYWLDQHGYEPAGASWEIYVTYLGGKVAPDRWRTELVVPYRDPNVNTMTF
jgi:effector-binding domain-containing protein